MILISLQYKKNVLVFPINPSELKVINPSPAIKTDIEGLGEVSTPTAKKLSTISINSFFWYAVDMTPSSLYVSWLKRWQESKKPAKLIVTKLNYSMYVTCENFAYDTKAGEEEDVYFNLDLLEYKPHGAKRLGMTSVFNVFDKILTLDKSINPSVLFPLMKPDRFENKEIVSNPYTTKKGDTLLSITKKILGNTSNWKKLYELNKLVFGNSYSTNEPIPIGTKLQIPVEWL